MKKHKVLKPLLILLSYVVLMVVVYLILKHFKLNSIETLKDVCNESPFGAILFIFLQIVQVVFLPFNGIIFTIPAIIIFGPLKAFLISYVGIVIGSIIMFYIGRFGGIKLMSMFFGDSKAQNYAKMLGKGKFLLPIFMITAVFPDDILCVSAGLSDIKVNYFLVVMLICRFIDLAFTCFIGTIAIKSPIGIALIVLFIILGLIFSIILTKKQEKIENWFVSTLTRNKNKG